MQVLFDVGFEVRKGEVLALLGTNGAGKSTILRVIAGLGTPARGVVRLNGRTITYTTPEQRAKLGIRILLGGKGVFPAMTVHENLEMAAFVYRGDGADFQRRLDRGCSSCSPRWPTDDAPRRRSCRVASSRCSRSAMALLHDPEVLLIDELSLGLAPLVVAGAAGRASSGSRPKGMTIIIVEQSLNVALSVADRAVFLEKGQVRFEGPAAELAERDDLARAVFLGAGRRLIVAVGHVDHVAARLQRAHRGIGDRSPRHGHRADLPIDAGHQLRRRQHGPGRRRSLGAPRHRVRHPVLARRDRHR